MASELKPCAHCDGAAELDYQQPFCAFPSGKMEKQVAIYCTECDVHMSMCYSDFPEYNHDQMAAILTEKWNTRPTPVAPVSPDAPGAARDVLAERRRQVSAEGWTPEHDDKHSSGQLAYAASVYALCAASSDADRSVMDEFRTYNSVPFRIRNKWPWDESWLKPTNRRRDLVKAAALILAEIERLDRLPSAPASEGAE